MEIARKRAEVCSESEYDFIVSGRFAYTVAYFVTDCTYFTIDFTYFAYIVAYLIIDFAGNFYGADECGKQFR